MLLKDRFFALLKKRGKAFLFAALFLLYLPAIEVLLVRFANPHITMPGLIWWCVRTQAPQKLRWLDLKDTPRDFQTGVLFAEDGAFFRHHGFDFKSVKQSLSEATVTKRPPRGASTITQQCARSLFLWQGRSWIRKALEAYYTIWMELFLSKERIFELYCNSIEFGEGVYGLEAAAHCHFGVCASQLTRDQIARLIAIMPNPRLWNPLYPPENIQRRQKWILQYINAASMR